MASFEESNESFQKPNEFEVEQIVKKRQQNGTIEYFLKWKGYDKTHNTWAKEDQLSCDQLLLEFENNLRHKSNRKRDSQEKLAHPAKKRKIDENNNPESTFLF